MDKEQIEKLNEAIRTIRDYCKTHNCVLFEERCRLNGKICYAYAETKHPFFWEEI